MKKPEFKLLSIYPLSEIKEIYNYNGSFCGVEYDSEKKLRVAREIACFYAEIKPEQNWKQYYPSNEEMGEVVKIIDRLVNRKKIKRDIPDDEFRFKLTVYYFMCTKKVYHIPTFEGMIKYKDNVIKAIASLYD